MKRVSIWVLAILFSFPVFSQQFSIGIRGGLGNYSMSMLDRFQQYRTENARLPLKITESYPLTPFYRAELALNDFKYLNKLALFYGVYSTGARSTVSDYSGRADLDAVIRGNQFGLTVQKAIFENGQLSYGFYAEGAYLVSDLKTKDLLEIYSPSKINETQEYSFRSKGFSCEPGIMVCYRLNPFVLQVNLGYQADFSGKLYVKGSKDNWLVLNNEAVKPQWSGLRLGIQVSYLFRKKKTEGVENSNETLIF
jgi:hypothetical protein